MSDNYPLVALSEVLTPISRPERVEATNTYRLLGAHWYAEGLYTKDMKTGAEIQADKVYRVEEGDFVYNRLFAWKGSFALATAGNDGGYVSNEFPCFIVDAARAVGQYLWRYFSQESSWDEAFGLSTGGTPTSRNRLKEEKLLAMRIPLPPLAEQRRTVARIETLAAKIAEARGLRRQAMGECDRVLIAMAHRPDLDKEAKQRLGWHEVAIGDVVKQVQDIVKVDVTGSYPNFGIYSFGRGLFPKPPVEGIATSASVLYRVRNGQFIYSRLFAFEGSYGMVTNEYDGCFVSGEYPTFECDPEHINANFLNAYFKAPSIWATVAMGSKGLGDRRQRVQPTQVLLHRLMLPPLEWQQRITTVQAKMDAVRRLQAETAAELDALLPAVLHRAFRGEL